MSDKNDRTSKRGSRIGNITERNGTKMSVR